jgi:hypothetical protein
MAKKKKQKRTPEQMHRQIQDSLQALPYAIEQHQKQGQGFKAAVLRYVSGPVLKLMNKAFSARRYRGTEGKKLQQTEQMRRHLEQRQAAMKHLQGTMQQAQKRKRAR